MKVKFTCLNSILYDMGIGIFNQHEIINKNNFNKFIVYKVVYCLTIPIILIIKENCESIALVWLVLCLSNPLNYSTKNFLEQVL